MEPDKEFTEPQLFITIDFDGTVTDTDVTDAVLSTFAKPGWEKAERLWEAGRIGSMKCLATQMSFVEQPLEKLLEFVDSFKIDKTFPAFIDFLKESRIPFCIVSDGFKVFIDRLFGNAGMNLPVFASELREEKGRLKTFFPYAKKGCLSATCKCAVAGRESRGLSVVHIGDGRSDFCLAREALYVFSRGALTGFCTESTIAHSCFNDFSDISKTLEALSSRVASAASAGITRF